MQDDIFSALIRLRLSIVRRAADMLVLHFGDIRTHPSGEGTVCAYALHVQCPWRLEGPRGIVTGSNDLWRYAGPGDPPPNWSYEDGFSLQDKRLGTLFARDEATQSWINESDAFVVTSVNQTKNGDLRLALANNYAIVVFPAGCQSEAWRFFAPASDHHTVFPPPASDFAISRRKKEVNDSEWEVWLRAINAPAARDHSMQAPPAMIVSANGARYRCGGCGIVLAIAEVGSLKGFVIHCGSCDQYNEVPL